MQDTGTGNQEAQNLYVQLMKWAIMERRRVMVFQHLGRFFTFNRHNTQ